MRDPRAANPQQPGGERYLSRLLEEPRIGPRGVRHRAAGASSLLRWEVVRHAIAAEIGEPEGVRTIVFDLIAEVATGSLIAHRMDAEPGEEAMETARALTHRLAPEICGACLKSLAADGIPSRWYPDLESFEDDAVELLRDSAAGRATEPIQAL